MSDTIDTPVRNGVDTDRYVRMVGTLGHAVVDEFLSRGHAVVALDRPPTEGVKDRGQPPFPTSQ